REDRSRGGAGVSRRRVATAGPLAALWPAPIVCHRPGALPREPAGPRPGWTPGCGFDARAGGEPEVFAPLEGADDEGRTAPAPDLRRTAHPPPDAAGIMSGASSLLSPAAQASNEFLMQKVLITGFGFMGGLHAQVYAHLPRARVAAIVDPDAKGAARKARSLGVTAPVFADFDEALGTADADVVDI